MRRQLISIQEISYFSQLIRDYIDQKSTSTPFYNRFPTIDNFKAQIQEKQSWFTSQQRDALVTILKQQYQQINTSAKTNSHLELLAENNTFTVTTGHQLNLFTGPLYFLYKIISAINLAKELKAKYPDFNFVPVYWMATEDHDFDEINYFNFRDKKVAWERESGGAVGDFSTEGLVAVADQFAKLLGKGINADEVLSLFKSAYLNHSTLSEATRYLADQLFSTYGLVIIDAHDSELKKVFIPYMKEELLKQSAFKEVESQSRLLENSDYRVQVNPREINLFYLADNLRERIIYTADRYSVTNTSMEWTEAEILSELEQYPERFSPNVIMRPLYQEVVLPNLCYIGGGGEIAYWLQLKGYFNQVNVPFPMLLLRNSALLISQKQSKKLQKLNITAAELFLPLDELVAKKVREASQIPISFETQKAHLQEQFKELYTLAKQTDASFLGAVKAQEKKQLNGLMHLEKRLLKAQKRKMSEMVLRIKTIHAELFPKHNLQERVENFSESFLRYGPQLIGELQQNLDPLAPYFSVLTSEN